MFKLTSVQEDFAKIGMLSEARTTEEPGAEEEEKEEHKHDWEGIPGHTGKYHCPECGATGFKPWQKARSKHRRGQAT